MDNGFSFDFSKPYSVAERFTTQELYDKIRIAFAAHKLENIPFEFGIATINNGIPNFERHSSNFEEWYEDSAGHKAFQFYLSSAKWLGSRKLFRG